jgi:hypothetical protein
MTGQSQLRLGAFVASAGLLAACGSTTEFSDDDGGSAPVGPSNPTPQKDYVGAAGVAVTQVAIYQGPERILAQGGVAQPSSVPLVAGRDALVRVFYQAPPEQTGASVLARLEIAGQEPIEFEHSLGSLSSQADQASTINFVVPGDRIGATFEYRVSLLQEGEVDNPGAHHPDQGLEAHVVDGPANTFRVMMVPFAYNADGSGRVPDLSPEAVEIYRQRFLQLYPVSNVEVAVREPVPWSSSISSFGQGWQAVGQELVAIRAAEKPSEDWYYYAIFQPTDTVSQFCSQGCLLGVTLLNNQPVDVGQESLRIALGVGFPQVGPDTAVHEIGHAHGRPHAPCGPGLDPQSIDPSYPHAGGGIGPWSYDIVSQTLVDPATVTDIMGYCDNQWISDYNFANMLARGQFVNQPKLMVPEGERISYELIAFDETGQARHERTIETHLEGAPTVPIHLSDRNVEAHLYRWDHLPGGWLFVPSDRVVAGHAEIELDGRRIAVDLH